MIISTLMLFCLSIGVGCDCSGLPGSGSGLPASRVDAEITLDTTSANMIVGDYLTIASFTNKVPGLKVVYSSEDESVATVDAFGKIEAINVGSTNILATYGEEVAKCAIKVEFDDSLPELIDVSSLNSEYVLYKNNTYSFQPAIRYRGRIYYDGDFIFSSSNKAVAEFNGYDLNTKDSIGVTSCYVEGTWRGFSVANAPTLRFDFSVEVMNEAFITLKNNPEDFIEIYTRDSFEGKTYKNSSAFIPEFYANGDKVDVNFSVIVDNKSIVNLANNAITAKKFGETTIEITCQYEGFTYARTITVEVIRPVADYQMELDCFSSGLGTFKDVNDNYANKTLAEAIYGNNNVTIIEASQDGKKLVVEDNKILEVKGVNSESVHTMVTIGTETELYNVPLHVYGLYIKEAEDLTFFSLHPEYEDYYYLANNIDASTVDLPLYGGDKIYYGESRVGLIGVFEGNGHTISNLTTKSKGLFGSINGGTVQNVGFINARATGYYPGIFGHTCEGSSVIKNVYVQLDYIDSKGGGLFQQKITAGCKLENVVVEYEISQDTLREFFTDSSNSGNRSTYAPNRGVLYKGTTYKNCLSISYAPVGMSQPQGTDYSWTSLSMAENQYKLGDADENGDVAITGVNDWDKEILSSVGIKSVKKAKASSNAVDCLQGIKAYQTRAALVADKANNEKLLASFDSEYWTVDNGIPYWKDVYENLVTLVVTDGNGNEVTDYTLDDTTKVLELALEVGTSKLDITIDAPSAIKVSGNKISLRQDVAEPVALEVTISAILNGKTVSQTIAILATPKQIVTEEVMMYSAKDGLDFAKVNSAFDLTGANALTAESISSFYVGNSIEKQTGDVIVPVVIKEDRSDVETTTLKLVANGKMYVIKNLKAYSMVIDEVEDLNHFVQNNLATGTVTEDRGYYILAKDLDATNFEMNDHAWIDGKVFPNSLEKKVGFMGVFDGNGHTINGLTAKSNGIFGTMTDSLVKNVGFTNVKLTGYYCGLFAHLVSTVDNNDNITAEFVNVYVHVESVTYGSGGGGVLAANDSNPRIKLTNVVIDYQSFDTADGSADMNRLNNKKAVSGVVPYGFNPGTYKQFVNVFLISKAPINVKAAAYHVPYNKVSVDEFDNVTINDEFAQQIADIYGITVNANNVAKGIKAYDDFAAMSADAANNAEILATYNSEYWVVKNGIPQWKTAYAASVVPVVKDAQGNVVTDVTLNNTSTKFTLELCDNEGALSNVTITVPQGIVLNGNVINLANEPTSKGSYEVVLSATVDGNVITKTLVVNYTNETVVTGKVLYSQDDKSLDFDSLKKALADVDVEITSLDDISYRVGEELVSDLELEVIIKGMLVENGDSDVRKVETAQKATVIVNDKPYVLTNVYAYTKLIDEVADLDWLSQPRVDNGDGTYSYDVYDGYYLMTKDLDGKGLGANGANYQIAGNATSTCTKGTGLTGIFDGNGHTISNLIFQSDGLFGQIKGGAVINVAFIDITLGGYYPSLLARSPSYATVNGVKRVMPVLKNIYVEGITMEANKPLTILCYGPFFGNMKNVVVNHTMTETQKANALANKTAGITAFAWVYSERYPDQLVDTYLIGDLPLSCQPGSNTSKPQNNNFIFAGNMLKLKDGSETEYELKDPATFAFLQELLEKYNWSGEIATSETDMWKIDYMPNARQYIDTASMAQDATANAESLATFDSKYWTVINGVPYWNGTYANKVDVVIKDANGNSLTEVELENADTKITIDLFDGTQTLGATIVAPEGVTVNGNVINLTNNPTSVGSYEITVSKEIDGVLVEKVVTIYFSNETIVEGEVLYSANDKAFDLDSLKKALAEVDVTISSLDEVTCDSDLACTVTGVGYEREVAVQETKVTVAGKVYALKNVYAYTQLIDEIEDLGVFNVDNSTSIVVDNGYYLVTKDLDATNYEMLDHVWASGVQYPNSNDKKGGFWGVFDGNGHTISNLTVKSNGIFGTVTDSVIKNVGFTNVSLTGYYKGLFANIASVSNKDASYKKSWPTIENVFVEISSTQFGQGGGSALFGTESDPRMCLTNVVIDYQAFDPNEATAASWVNGQKLVSSAFSVAWVPGTYKQFVNSFVISKAPINAKKATSTNPVAFSIASNKVVVDGDTVTITDEYTKTLVQHYGLALTDVTKSHVANGVKLYDTYADLANDASNNADMLASYDSKYWTIINGVPYWNGTYGRDIALVMRDADGNVVTDVELYDASTQITIDLYDGTQYLGATVVAPEGVTVNGNVINLTSAPTSKGTYEITVSKVVEGVTISKTVTIAYNNETLVSGVVRYSAEDNSFELDSLKKALADVDVNISSVSDVTLNDEINVVITGTSGNRAVEAQTVKVSMGGSKVYVLKNVYAYTRLIDEASDLNRFIQKNETNNVTMIQDKGYYLVTKDIDATGFQIDSHEFINGYPDGTEKKGGFMGVFDGDGHVISNFVSPSNGIFGTAYDCVIKNIGFVNTTIGNYSLYTNLYPCLFANAIGGNPEINYISNLYVQVDSMVSESAVLCNNGINQGFTYITNLVIDWSNFGSETEIGWLTKSGGRFGAATDITANANANLYRNSFVISKGPLNLRTASNAVTYLGVAENKVTVTDGVVTTTDATINAILSAFNYTLTTANIMPGVKSYNTYAEMAQDATANAEMLATFDSKYWTVINGVPFFNGTYTNYIDAVMKDAEGNVVTDVVLEDATTKITIDLFDGTQALGATVVAPEGVTVNGNVINLTSAPAGKGSYEITVSKQVDGKTITKTVTISYTNEVVIDGKVLYSKADKSLDVESLNKALVAEGASEIALADITGYYVGDATEATTTLDLEVIVSGKIEANFSQVNRVVDTAQKVKVVANGKAYILNNVYAYTKLIDELSDLDWFSQPRMTVADYEAAGKNDWNGVIVTASEISYVYDNYDGYYLMTKNLDGKGKGENGADYAIAGTYDGTTATKKSKGVTGVFDGNGYVISNMLFPSDGLFGNFNGGTIKNVAFKDITLGGYYPSLLARNPSYTTINGVSRVMPMIKNVYVEGTKYDVANKTFNILTYNHYFGLMDNVVVNHTMTEQQKTNVLVSKKLTGIAGFAYTYNNSSYGENFKNLYIIGDLPISVQFGSGSANNFIFAGNMLKLKDGSTTEYELANPTDFAFLQAVLDEETVFNWTNELTTVKEDNWKLDYMPNARQYINAEKMALDATANAASLATFDSAYWTVVNGVPTWNALNA